MRLTFDNDELIRLRAEDAAKANPFDRMHEDPTFFGVDLSTKPDRAGIFIDGEFREMTGDEAVAAVSKAFGRLTLGKASE